MCKLIESVKAFEREYPERKESLVNIFHRFLAGLSTTKPHLLPPVPPSKPDTLATKLNNLKEALTALQNSVASLQSQASPSQPLTATPTTKTLIPVPTAPKDHTSLPAILNTTSKTPPHPSIVIHTATIDPTNCPPLHILCNIVNESLQHLSHPHIHISSAKWTAKGNIVLTSGHTNTLQQLISAGDPITKTITSKFPTIHEHTKAPQITANVKWSKDSHQQCSNLSLLMNSRVGRDSH